MEDLLDDPRLEAERLRRQAYLERFGKLSPQKEEDHRLDRFNN